MTTLQNRWYRCLVAQLGADASTAQIIQPCPPIEHSDEGLWLYPGLLAPESLTFNTRIANRGLFFHEYAAVASELVFPADDLQRDIGADVYALWQIYLSQQNPPPSPDQLPRLFQDWAAIYAPDVVNTGVSDLLQMALIADARQALQPYIGSHAQAVDFGTGFGQLQQLLQNTPEVQLSFESSTAPADVSQSWTGGLNTDLYGLWSGYQKTARLSRRFAASQVKVTVRAHHYLVWTASPGAWYNSSLLNNAYANHGSPPWPAEANPTWDDAFGPDGSLARVIASLLLMDGLYVHVTSDAAYAALDQQTLLSEAAHGFWPFFIPDQNGRASTTVTFDRAARLSIDTITRPGNPVVIGANVLDIARYLGQPG
jgi:hypothetical protein